MKKRTEGNIKTSFLMGELILGKEERLMKMLEENLHPQEVIH